MLLFTYSVLSLNNSKYGVYSERVFIIEIKINDTMKSASYHDLYLEIDNRIARKREL